MANSHLALDASEAGWSKGGSLVLVFEDQAQVLNVIERFRAIVNEPFLDRGTVRRGGERGSILEFAAFELEKMLLHNFRAESGAPANRRGRRPGKRKGREERDGLRIEMAGAARVYETRKAAV